MKTIKIEADLLRRAEEFAKKAGYSSVTEFVEHLLEKELSRAEGQPGRDEVERRLKGLGYLD